MTGNRYPANLPSVGLSTFFRSQVCEDLEAVSADVAFLGVPYDAGSGFRPGARFGPREIRSFSLRYSAWGGHSANGYWNISDRRRYLEGVSMVDCGDVDIAYYDFELNRHKITNCVRPLIASKALPVLIGGDHSITFPAICAFEGSGPIDVVHFDAHMDWRDHIDGVRHSNASPLRRVKELPFVEQMVQLGIRDIRTSADQVEAAEAAGSVIFTRDAIRERGVKNVIVTLPTLRRTYVTIEIDALDPSIAPGTQSPTVDGLLYHELKQLLAGISRRAEIVAVDLVEVNPMIDPTGQTCLLASTLITEFLGMIFAARTAGAVQSE
jgi:agmatinase